MNELEIQAHKSGLIWENNPALVQLLGLSPLLAVSNTVVYGIGLGLATLCVCVASCLTTALLKPYIAYRWRLLWFMVILAAYASVVDTLSQLYFYPLYLKLGIYVPLICCNAAILVRMETSAQQRHWPSAALDGFKTGLGFLIALVLFSACRELLISASLLRNWQLLLPADSAPGAAAGADIASFFRFAETPAGAFILLGLMIASFNFLTRSTGGTTGVRASEIVPAKRARVTGRLIKDDAKEMDLQ